MNKYVQAHRDLVMDNLLKCCAAIDGVVDIYSEGQLSRVVGLTLEARGCVGTIGSRCWLETENKQLVEAEIIGFSEKKTYLMPIQYAQGLSVGARVINTNDVVKIAVGPELIGRIIDGCGVPLDNKGSIHANTFYPIISQPINPLQRLPISSTLDVGIQVINTMLTVGRGQRIGLFAGSGVGKSILLGMMTRFTRADIVVVALVGERGREVKEFIEQNLGTDGLARSVVVAAPADTSPLMRLHAALQATAIAEYFRDQGSDVLLLMDSLTRFAQAQREIGLSTGEPPTSKGYTPSVFSKLSQLVERAGTSATDHGSITAIYTVLAEGDDQQDPIVDAARAILDGHIVLSRELADAGHFPAIDIESSVSRVMSQVISTEHQQAALAFRHVYTKYQQNKDLISIGAYMRGSDAEIDIAIQQINNLRLFLQQGMGQICDFDKSVQALISLTQNFSVMNNEAKQALTHRA